MEVEKEVRYKISKKQIENILNITEPYKEKIEMIDITCGYDGFDSYKKRGFICRVRKNGNKITLEVKNYFNKNECLEQNIKLENIIDGVNYLKLIGMTPYLYLKRCREVRKFKNLKIFIDEFDIIGDFVEIEYQDSDNELRELTEFIKLIKIKGSPNDMYGGIVREKITNSEAFKKKFEKNLENLLKF